MNEVTIRFEGLLFRLGLARIALLKYIKEVVCVVRYLRISHLRPVVDAEHLIHFIFVVLSEAITINCFNHIGVTLVSMSLIFHMLSCTFMYYSVPII